MLVLTCWSVSLYKKLYCLCNCKCADINLKMPTIARVLKNPEDITTTTTHTHTQTNKNNNKQKIAFYKLINLLNQIINFSFFPMTIPLWNTLPTSEQSMGVKNEGTDSQTWEANSCMVMDREGQCTLLDHHNRVQNNVQALDALIKDVSCMYQGRK